MIGYGQTVRPPLPGRERERERKKEKEKELRADALCQDMPVVTSPASMVEYSWKSSSDDMVALLSHLSIPRVILLGHDWGGAIVTRIYIHHPKVVTSIISLCTAYYPPLREYTPITEVARRIPSFTYQVALCDPQTERDIRTPEEIERFLRGLHRGLGDGFTGKFQVTSDLMKELGDQPRGKLMTKEDLAYYVEQYARNGMHGPREYALPRPNTEQGAYEEKSIGTNAGTKISSMRGISRRPQSTFPTSTSGPRTTSLRRRPWPRCSTSSSRTLPSTRSKHAIGFLKKLRINYW